MPDSNQTRHQSPLDHIEPPPGIALLGADELRDLERWMFTDPRESFGPEAIGLRYTKRSDGTLEAAALFFAITAVVAALSAYEWLHGAMNATSVPVMYIFGTLSLLFLCLTISLGSAPK